MAAKEIMKAVPPPPGTPGTLGTPAPEVSNLIVKLQLCQVHGLLSPQKASKRPAAIPPPGPKPQGRLRAAGALAQEPGEEHGGSPNTCLYQQAPALLALLAVEQWAWPSRSSPVVCKQQVLSKTFTLALRSLCCTLVCKLSPPKAGKQQAAARPPPAAHGAAQGWL
jgi:hypothetical protein